MSFDRRTHFHCACNKIVANGEWNEGMCASCFADYEKDVEIKQVLSAVGSVDIIGDLKKYKGLIQFANPDQVLDMVFGS